MRILCLDTPVPGASLEKYAPDLASLFFLNVTLSMKR